MPLFVPFLRRKLSLATTLLLVLPGSAHSVCAAWQDSGTYDAAAVSATAPSVPSSVQATVAPPDAREVIAWGRAAIGPAGLDGARRAAKAQALRDAVEKGTGVFVSARTLTHNFQLVKDQVITHAEGFATLKDIIREVDTPETVTLWMHAEVSLRPLAQQLKTLNLTRAWRIRVSTNGADGHNDSVRDREVVDALEKALLEAGFVVVSSDTDADIAVQVTPQFTLVADRSLDNRGRPRSTQSIRGALSIRATRAQTGEVVAVLSSSESAPQAVVDARDEDGVTSAVQAVAPRLTDALMLLPARDSQPIQLVVKGIGSAARATHLENLLGNLAGVRSVTRRSFEAGDAVWEMDVLSDAQADLARQMEEAASFKPFHLSVTSDTIAKIVANAPFGRHPAAKPKLATAAVKTNVEAAPPPAAILPSAEPAPVIAASRPAPAAVVAANSYRVNPRDGAQMMWIPEGTFTMGDDDIQNNPRHEVTLSGYYMYRDLVTVAMYRRFCAATGRQMPYPPRDGWRDDNPVVNVTYTDTRDYCNWAGVRLPTEAEWEKAARGTDARKFPWGDEFRRSQRIASYQSKLFGGISISLASSTAFPTMSPYGIADMDGKVAQWCADWYDPNFVQLARAQNPTGPYHSRDRVVRGCPADDRSPLDYRTARRSSALPDVKVNTIGFRAVAGAVRWASSGGQ